VNHGERRHLVVTRAMSLFARMGYAKVSFLDISEATGIARTALYRYFKTKREIFDAAIHEITSGIKRDLEAICKRELPVSQRMTLACNRVIDEFYGKKEFFSAIYEFVFSMVRAGEDMTSRIDSFTRGFKVVLRQLVTEGVADGTLRQTVGPDDAAEALFALMESVAFRLMLGVEKKSDGAKARFAAMIAALSS
jgi:AcrR family transcriptional regulator